MGGNRKKCIAGAAILLILSQVCTTRWIITKISRTIDLRIFTGSTEEKKRQQNERETSKKKRSEQRDSSYYHLCTTENGKVTMLPLLPQVILAGVQKAGTTAMYDLMKQHPRIHTTRKKEAHFFEKEVYTSTKGCEQKIKYAEMFVNMNQTGKWLPKGNEVIYFEKTPSYFHNPKVPRRIKSFCKQADPKILIILRNPIDRAVSQFKFEKLAYQHLNRTDRETFEEQVQLSVSRVKECGALSQDAADIVIGGPDNSEGKILTTSQRILPASSFDIRNNMSLSELWARCHRYGNDVIIKGFYALHLYSWIEEFPLDGGRIKVISYEDFRSNKTEVFDEVLKFIGLRPLPRPVTGTDLSMITPHKLKLLSLRNKTTRDGDNLFLKHFKKFAPQNDEEGRSTDSPILSDETREYLQRLYAPHVDQLADMLGEEWRNKWW